MFNKTQNTSQWASFWHWMLPILGGLILSTVVGTLLRRTIVSTLWSNDNNLPGQQNGENILVWFLLDIVHGIVLGLFVGVFQAFFIRKNFSAKITFTRWSLFTIGGCTLSILVLDNLASPLFLLAARPEAAYFLNIAISRLSNIATAAYTLLYSILLGGIFGLFVGLFQYRAARRELLTRRWIWVCAVAFGVSSGIYSLIVSVFFALVPISSGQVRSFASVYEDVFVGFLAWMVVWFLHIRLQRNQLNRPSIV